MIVVVLSVFENGVHQANLLSMGADLDELMGDIQFQLHLGRRPGDPELVAPPARGSTPATAALWGSTAALRNGQSHENAATANGGGHRNDAPPVMDPPRPQQPAFSPDGLTIFENDGPKCATHGIGKPSKRRGEFFCPKKVEDGYCQWVYPPAARA